MRVLDRTKDPHGGLRFRSEFLRSYLVGQIRGFLHDDDWFREVLLQAGARTIRLVPEGEREALGAGAQAQAFRFLRGGEMTARVRELRSPAEQESFLESLVLLEKIRRIHDGNREGAEGVFKLVDVGLVDGAPCPSAVEVYHYIPGVDLRGKVGKLDAPLVVKIGRILSRALSLVHSHDVIHRDIRPENVILQEHASPVLIDFGLACARSAPGGTPLDDEFTAPEVKKQKPEWSAAADVFALASTLDALLSPTALKREPGQSVHAMLRRFTSHDREARESAARLVEALERIGTELNIKEREQKTRDELLKRVQGDPKEQEIVWITRDRCALQISGFALGMYSTERERLSAAAYIVNQLVEHCLLESVGSYAKRTMPGRWPIGIEAIVMLRNEFTHIRAAGKDYRTYTPDTVLNGVRSVSDWIGARKVVDLIKALLELE